MPRAVRPAPTRRADAGPIDTSPRQPFATFIQTNAMRERSSLLRLSASFPCLPGCSVEGPVERSPPQGGARRHRRRARWLRARHQYGSARARVELVRENRLVRRPAARHGPRRRGRVRTARRRLAPADGVRVGHDARRVAPAVAVPSGVRAVFVDPPFRGGDRHAPAALAVGRSRRARRAPRAPPGAVDEPSRGPFERVRLDAGRATR